MPVTGEYEPSPSQWVRDQVAEYEESGGERANTLRDTGLAIVIFSTRGNRSGKVRKTPVMRVEHDGEYALVASKGGAPEHPVWYYNLLAHPDEVALQDGPEPFDVTVRQWGGAQGLVASGGRGVPLVRGLPEEDQPRDPCFCGDA